MTGERWIVPIVLRATEQVRISLQLPSKSLGIIGCVTLGYRAGDRLNMLLRYYNLSILDIVGPADVRPMSRDFIQRQRHFSALRMSDVDG